MSVWHGNLNKRKSSGGRRRAYRKKRKCEKGSFPVETVLGDTKRKVERKKGGNIKIKVLRSKYACVANPKNGKAERVEIKRVVKNPANVDYDRRGVMTKGAIIETPMGLARVTSRPSQDGVINAVLIGKKIS